VVARLLCRTLLLAPDGNARNAIFAPAKMRPFFASLFSLRRKGVTSPAGEVDGEKEGSVHGKRKMVSKKQEAEGSNPSKSTFFFLEFDVDI